MTLERPDLSINLNVDHTLPVSSTPKVQGQNSARERESRQQRRPAPAEEAGGEQETLDGDQPEHSIDSLA